MTNSSHYIGIMSGTSLDGVDAVIASFNQDTPQLIGSTHLSFDPSLQNELLALNGICSNELERAALAANQLVHTYAEAVNQVLEKNHLSASTIKAIGCHGQTIRHQPELGYTIQLNNPALLVELTGITVIADFRSRDIAAGGQGAPLVPAFHNAVFRNPETHRVIINIGGIANLTDLAPGKPVTGFDCGPGNMLLDAWTRQHRGFAYDAGGKWAASGKIISALLQAMLEESFFREPPPKSTGRDLFNMDWLGHFLRPDYSPQDVQATLLALTAESIGRAIQTYCQDAREIYLCGGGARNETLVSAISQRLPGIEIRPTDALGVSSEWVEAFAFAWLAKQTMDREPGNLTEVTGARHPCVLGGIYPA